MYHFHLVAPGAVASILSQIYPRIIVGSILRGDRRGTLVSIAGGMQSRLAPKSPLRYTERKSRRGIIFKKGTVL